MKPPKEPGPLLDPSNLRASDEQMRAMELVLAATDNSDPLVSRIRAKMQLVALHRQILTQLAAAFLTRVHGRTPILTGFERTQLCSEAWNLMNASTVFVTDFVASVEISQPVAEEICAALDAPDDEAPEDDPPGPDAMPELLTRARFNAVGELVTANPEE